MSDNAAIHPPDEFAERVAKVLGPDRLSLATQLRH